MNPAKFPAMQAITELKRVAADTVSVCEVILYATEGDSAAAVRVLPDRVRALMFRAQRCLTALSSEGIT